MTTLQTKGLTKKYGGFTALDNLDLKLEAGEVYGFLGPNGAGKSTTIRTLLNFIQPTSGSATINGLDIVKDSVKIKHDVGYLASDMSMYPKMTGQQFLDYMSTLQGNVDNDYRKELTKLLQAETNKKLGSLSRGNLQKFAIIQAFMHKPKILILDEPSSGLDPLMQEAFYSLLKQAKKRGATVFMSSHVLSEVQKICDRVGIIKNGKLIAERDIKNLIKEAAHTFEITFKKQPPLQALGRLKGVSITKHDGHHVTINLNGDLPPLLGLLAKSEVVQLEARQLDLEELFIHFYSDEEQPS